MSEDIDILIIKESNSQTKKIVPKIHNYLTKLNDKNIFFYNPENIEKDISERNFLHCDLKINLDNFNLNYSLDITTTNLLFYENSKKELLNIHNMFCPNSKTNEKIFINSLESWITIAEKIISVHKILNDKKDDLGKRDVRHFYDIYSWYKNNKNSENILKVKNIYKKIIESRKPDKKYFKSTNILENKLFKIEPNKKIKKKLNDFLKLEVFGEKNFPKKIFENIKSFYVQLKDLCND